MKTYSVTVYASEVHINGNVEIPEFLHFKDLTEAEARFLELIAESNGFPTVTVKTTTVEPEER